MTAPHYQEVKAPEVAIVKEDDGTEARIICGSFWGKKDPSPASPPTRSTSTSPSRPANANACPWTLSRHAFAYVFAGSGKFCNASGPLAVPTEGVGWLDTAPPADAEDRCLILFDSGDEVVVQAGEQGIRFLLVSGKPLKEPVAWYGPSL